MSTVVNQPYSTAGNGGRKLVRLENGWLVAGAIGDDTLRTVHLYVSKDNGDNWSPLKYHTPAPPTAIDNFSLVANGTKVLLFTGRKVFVQVYAFDATDGRYGNLWQSEERLYNATIDRDQTGINSVSATIDPSNGHLYAAWSSRNAEYPSTDNIRYSKSTDGGNTWSGVEQITRSSMNDVNSYFRNPSIVVLNGKPLIVSEAYGLIIDSQAWSSYNSSITLFSKDIPSNNYFISPDWGAKRIYSNGVNPSALMPQSNPSAVVDKDGTIHVAWHGKDSSNGHETIKYSYSLNGGSTWASPKTFPVVVSNGGSNYGSRFPSISVDKNNRLDITYYNNASGYVGILSVSSSNRVDWTKAVQISPYGTGSDPSTLYDPYFKGAFGDAPPTIYQTQDSVELTGEYSTNQEPTLTIKDDTNNPINEDGTVVVPRESSLVVKITASDEDEDQTLQYRVRINSKNSVDFTSIEKNEETVVEIGHWLFYSGMNSVEIAARDSEGGEVTITFNVIVDENLPIDSSSLANMKFNGYSLSTISLAELVNFLE